MILPFLVYAPYPLQRRLAEGFWVALISLLFLVYERTKLHTFRWSKLVLLLAFPSTLFLLAGSLLIANTPEKPLFRPADEVSAFNFLNEITDGEAIVLSSYETGNPMPAWAPVFVVIGHGPESIFLSELEPRVESFYQSQTPHKERWDLLAEFDVDYVFWGPAEQALGDFIPSSVAYLSSVYQNGDYEIYQVNLNGQ